jgi:hypothetical protein
MSRPFTPLPEPARMRPIAKRRNTIYALVCVKSVATQQDWPGAGHPPVFLSRHARDLGSRLFYTRSPKRIQLCGKGFRCMKR